MFLCAKHGMVELSTDVIRALQLRYPLCDVEQQMLLYGLWLMKNPKRRPVLILRGVENWLKKASPKAAMVDIKTSQWWKTEEQTLAMAKRLGIAPSPRDSWQELRAKIAARLSADSNRTLSARKLG